MHIIISHLIYIDVKVSESSFRKYLPKHIKKGKKATDLCPLCEDLPKVSKRKREIENQNLNYNDDSQIEFKNLQKYEIVINNHKTRKDIQHNSF